MHMGTVSSMEPNVLLRKIFESLSDAVFIIDAADRIIFDCNPAVERIFGYSPGELRGSSSERLHLSRERYLEFGRDSEKVLDAGGSYNSCFAMRRKDGSVFTSEHTVTGLRDEQGRLVAAVSVVRDLTPQRVVDRTLQLSEARFQALFENAAVGMVMVNVSGRIMRANPAFCAMLGSPEEELRGKTILEITHPDDIHLSKAKFEFEKDCSRRIVHLTKRYLRRDRSFVWARVTAKWICDTEDNPLFCVTVVQDLTREKQIEETLRTSEQKLRNFLNGLDELVFEFDAQGIYLNVWTSDEGLLVRPRGELVGRGVDEVVGTELGARLREAFARVLRREEGETLEYLLQIGGRERWFLARIAPIPSFDGTSRTVSFLAREITERKQLEERQHQIEEALRRSDQLKSELISTAAHELRTPLTAIQGFAELLTDEGFGLFDPQVQKEFLLEIRHQSEALNKIIDVMVDMTRIEAGIPIALDLQPVEPDRILRRAVKAFRLKFPARRFEDDEIEATPSPILIDADRLEQVLDNILSNAVKYSPPDRPITISAACRKEDYLVWIIDRGKGMTQEQAGQVFEKFFRADTSNTALGGLGLGMSIAKGIIEAHGGRIWVESEPGAGATFFFTLPLAVS